MKIEIRTSIFNPWSELRTYESENTDHSIGACSTFVGTMRDFNQGDCISSMTLDYYPGMTEKQLEKIARSHSDQHQLEDVLIIHRVGEIHPGESIVLVACWSSHRKQAFDACRAIMEDLKHNAPFWKQEQTEQGQRWVEKNTAG